MANVNHTSLSAVRAAAFALLLPFVISGCFSEKIPPPTETAARSRIITALIEGNDRALETSRGPLDVTGLERTINLIGFWWGDSSPQLYQALTDSAILLARHKHYDVALSYVERALLVCRSAFGVEHRETAYAYHDIATILNQLNPEESSQRAIEVLRAAILIRQKILGPDHAETAGAEAALAWQLLLLAKKGNALEEKRAKIIEAERLSQHARQVLGSNGDSSYSWELRWIALDCAFFLGKYDEAVKWAGEIPEMDRGELGHGLYPEESANDLLAKSIRARDHLN